MSVNGGSRARRVERTVLSAGLLTVACMLSGCASVSYVDAKGVRHVVGLVNMALPTTPEGGASAVSLTTFGLSFRAGQDTGTQTTLGYSRDLLLSVPSNACVDLATPGPCRELTATASGKARKEP